MIKGRQIIVSNETVEDTLIAVGASEKKNFVTKAHEGYKIDCVSQKLGFEHLPITLKMLPFDITEPTEVRFKGLKLSVYVMNGMLGLTGTADDMEIVD